MDGRGGKGEHLIGGGAQIKCYTNEMRCFCYLQEIVIALLVKGIEITLPFYLYAPRLGTKRKHVNLL